MTGRTKTLPRSCGRSSRCLASMPWHGRTSLATSHHCARRWRRGGARTTCTRSPSTQLPATRKGRSIRFTHTRGGPQGTDGSRRGPEKAAGRPHPELAKGRLPDSHQGEVPWLRHSRRRFDSCTSVLTQVSAIHSPRHDWRRRSSDGSRRRCWSSVASAHLPWTSRR